MPRRFFTEEERAAMREHWPQGGISACRKHLPCCTDSQIYDLARRLELRVNRRARWSVEQDETLRRLALEDGHSAAEIGAKLNPPMSRNAVIGRANRLGIALAHAPRPEGRKAARPKPKKRWPLLRPQLQPWTPGPIGPTPLPVEIPSPEGVRCTLEELSNGTCRWPIGDGPPFLYCAGPADLVLMEPYCAFHMRLAYQPTRRQVVERRMREGAR